MTAFVTAILGAWFALTLARQMGHGGWRWSRRIARVIERYDGLHLVPSFCFFAPAPPSTDFEVLYRDRRADGATTAWRALGLVSRRPWRPVWNPEKARYQAAFRCCTWLLRDIRAYAAASGPIDPLYLSDGYVALAHCVAAAPHSLDGEETQFLVAVTAGFDERKQGEIAFISPFFRL